MPPHIDTNAARQHPNKHMCRIHENSLPSTVFVLFLPLCAFNFHLPPSFALSPIYFGFPLLPSLHLSHKWPSMVISFVLFLVGRCRTFAARQWIAVQSSLWRSYTCVNIHEQVVQGTFWRWSMRADWWLPEPHRQTWDVKWDPRWV